MTDNAPWVVPPPRIYLAYVKRFYLDGHGQALQVLAGASFDETTVLNWIEEGKQINHDIWYEDIPIDNFPHPSAAPREILVHFTGPFMDEDYCNQDLQWSDPVGRKARVPDNFLGIERPQPEREGTQNEDGYLGDNTYLWRVPCPWKSRYLLSPFTESSNENINYGRPWSV
ncbi:hypothetical protein [Corynebacterium ureicelerivorans]|uniref:hypothetical protein n=1 Tax=Corynebacterium ureicelerivorans TaxID=401472 RepID=UPI002352EF4A|nr:hypothetical protein [Corynebacterium ureicelerivorans]MDN8626597.1 hypothetical protein [Corynebacterium ureicelerivorans]